MKHCNEYAQLSAYADGELCQDGKRLVEEHTSECDSCAALLEINREISASVSRSSVPVPEALRLGVMNSIKAGRAVGGTASLTENTGANSEKSKKKHGWKGLILTRYAPIAACLVVMLLVWQFWGSFWTTQNDDAAPSAVWETMNESHAESVVMDDSTFGFSAEEEAPASYEADTGVIFAPDIRVDAAGDFESEHFPAPQAEVTEHSDMDDLMMHGEHRSAAEMARIMTYIDEAYAQIYFTGDLPASLKELDPQPFGSWFGWQKVFEIPSSEVSALLAEIGSRRELDIIYNENHRDSKFAIVFFSQG